MFALSRSEKENRMFNSDKHREAGQSIFMSSMKGLANTGAVAATFFTTPIVYSASVDWIVNFAIKHYGAAWADLVNFAWFVLVACLAFFIARASLSTLLVMGGLAVATKFL